MACLGGQVLSGVFTRFAKGYRYHRSGLPDLVVWNSSTLDYRVTCMNVFGGKLHVMLLHVKNCDANYSCSLVLDVQYSRSSYIDILRLLSVKHCEQNLYYLAAATVWSSR